MSGVLMLLSEAEDKISLGVIGEPILDPTQSETLCMWRSFLTGTWEISCVFGSGIPNRNNKARAVSWLCTHMRSRTRA